MHVMTAAAVIKHYMKGSKLPRSPKLCLPSQIENVITFKRIDIKLAGWTDIHE
jgi:hypothetical protein